MPWRWSNQSTDCQDVEEAVQVFTGRGTLEGGPCPPPRGTVAMVSGGGHTFVSRAKSSRLVTRAMPPKI